jgi:hypothetical protein
MADNILRGFMNGKAKGEAMKAMKMKRETDNIRANVDLASKNFYNVAASGVDQNSKEFKDAKAASDGAWAAWTGYLGQHIAPPESGKKGKGAKVKEGMAGMFGKGDDPAQVSQGYYQVAVKMGNPVNHQVAALYGPQAQQARETAANTATAANTQSQNAITKANEEKQDMQDRVTLRTMESTRDAAKSDPNVTWTKKNQEDLYRQQDLVSDRNKRPTVKEVLERKMDRFMQLPKEERDKPEQQAVWRSLQAEGVEITGKNLERKVPTSAFQARMEAKEAEVGRPLTLKEVNELDKDTHDVANEYRALTGFLVQAKFDEQKATHVNAVKDRADRAMELVTNHTQAEIDKLETKEDGNKIEKDSTEYKSRMAQIEKNEYAAKIAIGKSLQDDLKQLKIDVPAPMPQQWESSYMKQTDRDKIFKGGKQEAAPSPTPKEEKSKPSSSAKGEAKLQPGQPLMWNGKKTSVQEVRHNNQGKYAYKIDNQWYTDDELKLK